jgi:hypothetical protein
LRLGWQTAEIFLEILDCGRNAFLLAETSRPEIAMAVHQTAHFSNQPMLSHKKSIMRLGRYLLDTRKCSIIYKPDKNIGLECYVDADFAGGWSQANSDNADNVLS